MNNFCYTLAIRQRTCENGVARYTDNVYTNVTNGTEILLNFGYILTFISSNSDSVTIQLSNPDQIPNLLFNITNNSYKVFDLPVQNGTARIYVGATGISCNDTIVCSSMSL